jgi:uncharacterized protein
MAKLLLVVAVVVLGAWLLFGRRRGGRDRVDTSSRRGSRPPAEPAPMVVCAHCGVHLPRQDAVLGGSGTPFCSEAHRDAGPR